MSYYFTLNLNKKWWVIDFVHQKFVIKNVFQLEIYFYHLCWACLDCNKIFLIQKTDFWWIIKGHLYTKFIWIPITFNNPLKALFSNKKYPTTIQTHPTQIVKVYFLLKIRFRWIFKDYWCTKSIAYHFLFRFSVQ